MELVSSDSNFDLNEPLIINKVQAERFVKLDPSPEEKNAVEEAILEFVKEKKRKLYGGTAMNLLLKEKGEPIYDEYANKDIDFYSPDPISDVKELCNKLHKLNFSNVNAKEAQHGETYKIFINYLDYCDITYVPNNIYNKMKFIELDGLYITHPWILFIDQFRILTDPLISYEQRLKKTVSRHSKLYKYYKLPIIDKKLEISNNNELLQNILNDLFENILIKLPNIIFTGLYIYNYYVNLLNKTEFINIPYYQCYSIDFENDVNEIISKMKKYTLNIEEHYPFFQFFGRYVILNVIINKVKYPVLYIYSNNNRCIAFKEVNAYLIDKTAKTMETNIKIGTFDFNILHCLILLVKNRVDKIESENDIIYNYINSIVKFRKEYLDKNNKTVYDDTPFESFSVKCIGITMDPRRESLIKTNEKFQKGKLVTWKYNPEKDMKKEENKYIFKNSSGNEIINKEHQLFSII